MKYNAFLPISALLALSLISVLVNFGILPPGGEMLTAINEVFEDGFYWVIFVIILLESILYIGFYFPGQFFAVVLVVGSNPTASTVTYLTIAMVFAATLGSVINYGLGRASAKSDNTQSDERTPTKNLLLAMIHINSLAFFMFDQGAKGKPLKIVWLAGLLNLPYYLLLIAGTAVLSEQVMAMAENTILLFSAITVWLVIALYFDIKSHKKRFIDMPPESY